VIQIQIYACFLDRTTDPVRKKKKTQQIEQTITFSMSRKSSLTSNHISQNTVKSSHSPSISDLSHHDQNQEPHKDPTIQMQNQDNPSRLN